MTSGHPGIYTSLTDVTCFWNEEDQKTVWGTVLPTNAIRFCLSIKVLFRLSYG